jgi:hypothetical protein
MGSEERRGKEDWKGALGGLCCARGRMVIKVKLSRLIAKVVVLP